MHFQHGPIQALGEPYAYSYLIGDEDMLLSQLEKAYSTPIAPLCVPSPLTLHSDSSVPKGYAQADLEAAVHTLLHADHERAYLRIVRANGGKVPRVPGYMLAKCWEHFECAFGAHTEEYIGD